MAKRKASQQAEFRGFINCELSQDEKAQLRSTTVSADELFAGMVKCIEAGLRLSFSYDNYNQCHQCVGSYRDPEHEMAGWMLVGRGSLPEKALKQFIFKHFTLLHEQWGSHTGLAREEFDD